MSLYQIMSTFIELEKRRKGGSSGEPMSDEEFDAAKDRVRALNLSDVRI